MASGWPAPRQETPTEKNLVWKENPVARTRDRINRAKRLVLVDGHTPQRLPQNDHLHTADRIATELPSAASI